MRGRFFATNGVAATFFKIAKGILEDAAKKKVMDTLKEQVGGNSKNEANKSFQKYMDQLCKHALDRYKEEILSLVESNEIVNPHPKGLDSSIHDLGSFRKTRDALVCWNSQTGQEYVGMEGENRSMANALLSRSKVRPKTRSCVICSASSSARNRSRDNSPSYFLQFWTAGNTSTGLLVRSSPSKIPPPTSAEYSTIFAKECLNCNAIRRKTLMISSNISWPTLVPKGRYRVSCHWARFRLR